MQQLLHSWQDPHARHAMFVHLPIVMAMIGVLPLLALAFGGFRSVTLRIAVIACFLLGSAGSLAAANSGLAAAARLTEPAVAPPLTEAERAAIEVHRGRGRIAWVWPLIPAALVAGTWSPRRAPRLAAGSLALTASVCVAGWFGVIGHAGGQLVYAHGLGVPSRATELATNRPPPEPSREATASGAAEP